ncbi:response regulator transcription factor, partial [Streptomyces sp. UNOC14_S4]|uniref:helix-turn-helix transcriptional regulator n=1 Tax=Streptomyces sp. UNOC14_S4 TaxID=2872340 RepID=UPI0023B14761
VLDRVRAEAAKLPQAVPLRRAYGLLLDAELRRAEGRPDPGRWSLVCAAFEPLGRPLELAQARHRWAEALLTGEDGAPPVEDGAGETAAGLLASAHGTAVRLGARPLGDAVGQLARRARLSLAPVRGARQTTGGGPLGLTPREQDVLRLVALGRSNRRIAEELFISPKTASVHVSNILAKLGASGRGEAAATAHRLGLFTPTAGV